MTDDPLKALIREADTTPPPAPTDAEQLAARLPALYALRRRRRRGAAGAVAAVLLAVVAWLVWPGGRTDPPPGSRPGGAVAETSAAETRRQLARVRARAAAEEQTVQRLLAAERDRQLSAKVWKAKTQLALTPFVDRQVALAANTLLLAGDYKRKRAGTLEHVREHYRTVVELFPRTVWADRARQRLNTIERQ